ncbi:phosphoglycerate kinase, partial [Brevibacterium paucivorans]|uniref:phosphoglycerate kinase n=1 Tax=Brevibacterium paucivorans TaxID=170994 RepID=UPI001CA583A9
LIDRADSLLIGGGMVFTFLKAQGFEVGSSLLEEDQIDTVKGYLEKAEKAGVDIVLPTDIVMAEDALVGQKVRAARRHGLTPILCVGEP